MAGCFGNHPFDLAMERQLYRYLDDCDNYEQLCEKITEKIPDDLWDRYDDIANKIIDKYLARRVERGIMTMEEAQRLIASFLFKIDIEWKCGIR